VKAVQQQLGHSSATLTLDRYGHLYADQLDGLSTALDALWNARPADSLRIPDDGAEVIKITTGL